jgi:S-layer protein
VGTTTLATGASFTSGAGADSVIIGATTKAISTGAGDDTVTLAAGTTALGTGGSIDAGAGTGDVLSFADADDATTASGGTTFETTISNFEKVKLAGAAGAGVTVDLANLDDISYVDVAVDLGQTLAVSNLASGGTVKYDAAQTGATTITVSNAAVSTTDVLNLSISAAAGLNVNTVNAANVETINLLTDDSAATATGIAHTATVVDTAATTITVTGDAGIALTQASTKITSFDASGVTKGAVSWISAALAGAATITGGAGNDTLDASLATKAVTLSGGDGNDTLSGGTAVDTINGGAGNDIISGGALADSLTGGAGRDIFTVATATDSNGVNSDNVLDFVSGTDFLSAGNHAIKYVGEASSYGTVLTSFTGVAYQAVMDASTKTVYIDVNGDSALTAADISINVNVSDLSQTDFAILGTSGADAIALSTSTDTVYSLGGADTITAAINTATLGSVSTDTFSISTAGMDIINAVATATINVTAAVGTDANYDVITNTAAGGAITKTVLTTAANEFHGLYDYATGTFTSSTTTAANSASTTDVAATMFLFATADGTTANQGIIVIGATGTATMTDGIITLV